MRFKTRKQLKKEILDLKERLEEIEREKEIVKEASIPKCESELCKTCTYCRIIYGKHSIILGCTKHMSCPDFELKPQPEWPARSSFQTFHQYEEEEREKEIHEASLLLGRRLGRSLSCLKHDWRK